MKIKIIDLLNKIANGEEVPEMVEYSNVLFKYDEDFKNYISENMSGDIFSYIDGTCFNDAIEVIKITVEPKKIEKIEWNNKSKWNGNHIDETEMLMSRTEQLKNSLNEVIDYINKGDE